MQTSGSGSKPGDKTSALSVLQKRHSGRLGGVNSNLEMPEVLPGKALEEKNKEGQEKERSGEFRRVSIDGPACYMPEVREIMNHPRKGLVQSNEKKVTA